MIVKIIGHHSYATGGGRDHEAEKVVLLEKDAAAATASISEKSPNNNNNSISYNYMKCRRWGDAIGVEKKEWNKERRRGKKEYILEKT